MSWDLLLLPAPADVTAVDGLPDDFRSDPLGSREHVAAALRERIPGIDLTDPAWGTPRRPGLVRRGEHRLRRPRRIDHAARPGNRL
ncbi:hypothetical protein GCM10020229_16970 [Kitasatospora albolonga]